MLFIDESIQSTLGYICVGFAYCEESPDNDVDAVLLNAHLTPGVHEYKSGVRMALSSELHSLRKQIADLVLQRCKIGVYIAPLDERPALLAGVARTARLIVERNRLTRPQSVYVDNGINGSFLQSKSDLISLVLNCDSRQVRGIQLADYVAYHCSYLMKCELECRSKTIRVEAGPHPLSEEQVALDWLLRTEIRRNFFVEHRNIDSIEGDDWFFNARGFGAFYSEGLPKSLLRAAAKTFDQMYFGCIW